MNLTGNLKEVPLKFKFLLSKSGVSAHCQKKIIRHNKPQTVINVKVLHALGERWNLDLAFHLLYVLFVSKFRKKNDNRV